jgi:hypothetical protein
VNGIAPALIEQTKMLPGSSEELSKSIVVYLLPMWAVLTSSRDSNR